MGIPAAGTLVAVPFPYSDLSGKKTRPVLLLAPAGYSDWILCQVTSNPYTDPLAVPLLGTSFRSGGLRHTSYVRPSKLFTANESIFLAQLGVVNEGILLKVRQQIATLLDLP